MKESMYKYMRVGIIHFMAYPETMKGEGPIIETIKKIVLDEYFNAIEISWIKDSKVRDEVKKMLEASHMAVAYGASPRLLTTGMNINHLNEVERRRAIENLKEGIDEAYYMGAKGFAFLSGRYEEDKKEEAFAALVESTKELCAYAKSKGDLRIVLEVFDWDIDKKSLIGPVGLAKKFAEEIRKEYDNFGLMVDLSHLPLLRESAREAIVPIKEYIVHAHIGNAVVADPSFEAYGDTHPRFGFPNSENDVEEVMEYLRVLMEVGFLNPDNPPIVSFEVKPWKDEDPDIVIANAKRVLNEAWARL
ncbi:sugar phosphate isomerase/epimerase [Caldicoprobacter guelmensis]|uniref:sugar phosphate isomerase/epimerase family protein n=1 Tax=Caldicoprobacter guelmensis TaxID=1170224 RepID=UPI00195BBC02|nr:TIM barrel protein [Caldicoprobacter guelmensis]MBM7583424.1 sugar phosphate isomerase/epimerase [Caldicoprobacter guelmensis]